MAGQVSASVLTGSPAGGAAFTGWYTARTTGKLIDGAKAAAISYGAASAGSAISNQPAPSLGNALGKAGASGVVAGSATAAMGGKFEEGAMQGAITSGAHSFYTYYTAKPTLNPEPGTKPAIAKSQTSQGCGSVAGCRVVDSADAARAIDPNINNIG